MKSLWRRRISLRGIASDDGQAAIGDGPTDRGEYLLTKVEDRVHVGIVTESTDEKKVPVPVFLRDQGGIVDGRDRPDGQPRTIAVQNLRIVIRYRHDHIGFPVYT